MGTNYPPLADVRETLRVEWYRCPIEPAKLRVRRLADLVNKGKAFDPVYLQPFLLTAVGHVLQQPFKLHSVNGHDPQRGNPPQALHADWGGERSGGKPDWALPPPGETPAAARSCLRASLESRVAC